MNRPHPRLLPAEAARGQGPRIEATPNRPAKYFRNILPDDFPHSAHADLLARTARPFDMDRYRAIFPDRWAAFLRAQFRSTAEVQIEFGVSERTARNWLNGTGGEPAGGVVAACAAAYPQTFLRYLNPAA